MSNNTISCYLFHKLPGTHESWTLAVFATSLQDARHYIKTTHGNGVFTGEVKAGKVNASCGATTSKASAIICNRNRDL